MRFVGTGGKEGLGFVLSGSIQTGWNRGWELMAGGLSGAGCLSLRAEEKGIWERGRLRGFFELGTCPE